MSSSSLSKASDLPPRDVEEGPSTREDAILSPAQSEDGDNQATVLSPIRSVLDETSDHADDGDMTETPPNPPIPPPQPLVHFSSHGSYRPEGDIPRMCRRDLPAFQSSNQFAVRHRLNRELCCLLRFDWFHVILNQSVGVSLLYLLIIWTVMILVFASVYTKLDRESPAVACGLGLAGEPIKYNAAFAFSLETCTTVGYGLPSGSDAYFNKCPGLQTAIYCQMVWSMLFNAFLFAFFYTSLAKANKRGFQVLFSRKAIVSSADGNQVRLQIRVYDMDARNPVVEAHVRLYAWSRHRPVPRPLRILQPNDELGALLFMSMPQVVTHHVDIYSLLHPPLEDHDYPVTPSGVMLRQSDSAIGSREEVICPVCGESYGTFDRWVKHVRYNKKMEEKDGWAVEGSHLSIPEESLKEPEFPIRDIQTLKKYFEDEMAEIMCVVEGIDPLVSGTFQALQSYRYEDIIWDKDAHFRPCLDMDGDNIVVDIDDFHEVVYKKAKEKENSTGSTQSRPTQVRQRRRRRRKMTSHRTHDSFMGAFKEKSGSQKLLVEASGEQQEEHKAN